jgi:hypothetical protein
MPTQEWWLTVAVPVASLIAATLAAVFGFLSWRVSERQAEHEAAKREMRPDLVVLVSDATAGGTNYFVNVTTHRSDSFTLDLYVTNYGSILATDVVVEYKIDGLKNEIANAPVGRDDGLNFETGRKTSVHVRENVIPEGQVLIGRIYASARPGEYEIAWNALDAHGRYPREVPGYGSITVYVKKHDAYT